MENRKTRDQHFVQVALVKHWEENGLVGVARKNNNFLINQKSKSSSSVFYEESAIYWSHGKNSI